MKAKLFAKNSDCGERYCIDKKMHVTIGHGFRAGPCDGSCEPKEVEFETSHPQLNRVINCFLETGKSSWSETEPEDEAILGDAD